MMAGQQVVKTPFEEILIDWDFTKDLDPGESLLQVPAPTIVITPATSPALQITDVTVSSPRVQAKAKAGLGGTRYHASCQAETTNQKRELCGDLYVEPC